MPESPRGSMPTPAQCRAAARAVRGAELSRQAIGTIRPRGLTGVFRSRLPLAMAIRLAARENRLVWHSPEEFAVLERPWLSKDAPPPRATRAMRLLDGGWELVPAWSIALGLLLLFVPVVIGTRLAAAPELGLVLILSLALLIMLYLLGLMLLMGVRAAVWMWRNVDGFTPRAIELARDPYLNHNWSLSLCHVTEPGHVDAVLRGALRQVRTLTGAGQVILCPMSACTSTRAQAELAADRRTSRLQGMDPELFILDEHGPAGAKPVRGDLHPPTGWVSAIVGMTLVFAAVTADVVADEESAACGTSCAGHPATYGAALMFLLRRMSVVGQADGVVASSRAAQIAGAVYIMVGVALYGFVFVAVRRFLRLRREAIEALLTEIEAQTRRDRILILTAATVEFDAVVQAVRAALDDEVAPVVQPVGAHSAYYLGTIGRTEIMLALSEQGTSGTAAMRDASANLIGHFKPVSVFLTGICYGLREQRGQRLGDVIVGTRLRDMGYRKKTDTGDILRGDRVTLSDLLINRCRSAAVGWTRCGVHFGLMLSENVLLNSVAARDELIRLEPDAEGGEMEGAGVYFAVRHHPVEWILIKGISDWGAGKTDDVQALAARNAADFVVRVIRG
ncbi:nucleoside phosphorylase [Allocatelliglobosispora scoriae]|uniref:Nucleoside phosphorylase n=1 Tax=Allocatelliglobosispora scoriae TaxID=643052 RepID=A0A841C345_9ACTN|nr:hypothetical protein [Allocatelliglobosispora scoriae]MBB5873729.1 nucleoside phosphorylase [Allocatelliglobosispora scoriae]